MDLARLVALWEDQTLRVEEIAEQLNCTPRLIYKLADRHGLGRRKSPRKRRASIDDGTEITWRDPTPAEIERMKEELWQRKLAKLRAETPEETAERIYRENMQLAVE